MCYPCTIRAYKFHTCRLIRDCHLNKCLMKWLSFLFHCLLLQQHKACRKCTYYGFRRESSLVPVKENRLLSALLHAGVCDFLLNLYSFSKHILSTNHHHPLFKPYINLCSWFFIIIVPAALHRPNKGVLSHSSFYGSSENETEVPNVGKSNLWALFFDGAAVVVVVMLLHGKRKKYAGLRKQSLKAFWIIQFSLRYFSPVPLRLDYFFFSRFMSFHSTSSVLLQIRTMKDFQGTLLYKLYNLYIGSEWAAILSILCSS